MLFLHFFGYLFDRNSGRATEQERERDIVAGDGEAVGAVEALAGRVLAFSFLGPPGRPRFGARPPRDEPVSEGGPPQYRSLHQHH